MVHERVRCCSLLVWLLLEHARRYRTPPFLSLSLIAEHSSSGYTTCCFTVLTLINEIYLLSRCQLIKLKFSKCTFRLNKKKLVTIPCSNSISSRQKKSFKESSIRQVLWLGYSWEMVSTAYAWRRMYIRVCTHMQHSQSGCLKQKRRLHSQCSSTTFRPYFIIFFWIWNSYKIINHRRTHWMHKTSNPIWFH